MNRIVASIVILLMFAACSKTEVIKPTPESQAGLARTLVYTNRNNTTASSLYFGKARVDGVATVTGGFLTITIDASPKANGEAGEVIAFKIDAAHLQSGLVKTYTFTDPAAKIISSRYTYINRELNGDMWASLIDSETGTVFGGSVTITSYDTKRNLLSGEFQITVPGLIVDPTKKSIGLPIDPQNKCDLSVAGDFANLKAR